MRPFRLLALVLIPWLLLAAPAHAATITFNVDTNQDATDSTLGDGICHSASGCSLRAALEEVDNGPGSTTYDILLPPGTYTLTDSGTGEDFAATGDLDINSVGSTVTIEADTTVGGNSSNVIIEAGGGFSDRLFQVVNASGVTFRNLTLRNANTAQNGGAIYNSSTGATLTLIDDTLSGNTVDFSVVNSGITDTSTGGGAIYNNSSGALTIRGCNFSGNIANSAYGGAIYDAAGALTIDQTTFDGNQTYSFDNGGALYTLYSVTGITVTNSTFSNNKAGTSGSGGAVMLYDQQPSVSTVNPTASFSNTVFDNNSGGPGPAITNYSDNLVLANDTIRNNNGLFGAIYNPKTLTVSDSTFSANTSSAGGAIDNSGSATITGSTFTGNTVSSDGGAINSGGFLDVRNSTFVGNQAKGNGGAIAITTPGAYSNVLNNVTIVDNTADSTSANLGTGGGLYVGATTAQIADVSNTIISGNIDNSSAGNADCYDLGPTLSSPTNYVVSLGYNLVQNPGNCSFAATGDQTGIAAGLTPSLGMYGGSTETLALTSGSPAIDGGNPGTPLDGGNGRCEGTDQRGLARAVGTACDIGAFEYYGTSDLGISMSQTSSSVSLGSDIVYRITVSNAGPDGATGLTVQQNLPDPTLTTFASATSSSSGFNCGTPSNGVLTCTLASLAAGDTSTITVHVTADTTGNVTSSATVNSAETDPDLSNNDSGPVSTSLSSGVIVITPGGGGFGLLSLFGLLALAAIGRKALGKRAPK
jgi:hypothetical protein